MIVLDISVLVAALVDRGATGNRFALRARRMRCWDAYVYAAPLPRIR